MGVRRLLPKKPREAQKRPSEGPRRPFVPGVVPKNELKFCIANYCARSQRIKDAPRTGEEK